MKYIYEDIGFPEKESKPRFDLESHRMQIEYIIDKAREDRFGAAMDAIDYIRKLYRLVEKNKISNEIFETTVSSLLKVIRKDPQATVLYADMFVYPERFYEAEDLIASSVFTAGEYAERYLKSRWIDNEDIDRDIALKGERNSLGYNLFGKRYVKKVIGDPEGNPQWYLVELDLEESS